MNEYFYICQTNELKDPSSRGFSIRYKNEIIDAFIVHKNGQFFAYRNQCPHTGAPLDWVEHQFLDADLAMIQCAVHDARFEIETGECLFGPCPGESLQALEIEQRDKRLFLVF